MRINKTMAINIYYNRKTKFIKTINSVEEFVLYSCTSEIFPKAKTFEVIRKIFNENECIDYITGLIEINALIAKNEFHKHVRKAMDAFLRKKLKSYSFLFKRVNDLMSAEQLCYNGYSFEDVNDEGGVCKHTFPGTIDYWLNRNFLPNKAEQHARDFFNVPWKSIPKNLKCTTHFAIDYWTIRGYSNEDAIKKISEIQSKNSKSFHEKRKKSPEKYYSSNATRIEYWLKKYNGDGTLAANALRDRQTTFSLEKCIEKHGGVLGYIAWQSRQIKWQNAFKRKTCGELADINRRRGKTMQYHIDKGGVEYWKKIIRARCSRLNYFSEESFDRVFNRLESSLLCLTKINRNNIFHGKNRGEMCLIDENGKTFFYDFAIDSPKIIVEYHGKAFHADPSLSEGDKVLFRAPFGNNTYEEVLKYDEYKQTLAEESGYKFFAVYSSFTFEQIQQTINSIIDYVNQN
jgi:hypothetical protein